jgi:hypothetical protein
MKHTEGTWLGKEGAVYTEETGKTLALIPYFDEKNEEEKANLTLIAAAPELLKALQYAIKFIKLCPKLKEEDKPRGLERWESLIYEVTECN